MGGKKVTKGSKGKRKTPKVSLVKLSNKRLNKLAKQGKLRKKVPKSQLLKLIKDRVDPQDPKSKKTEELSEQLPQQWNGVEEEEKSALDRVDYDYYGTKQTEALSFLVNLETEEKPSRKRKKVKDDGEEDDELERRYEKKAALVQPDGNKVMKALLPIKSKEKGIETRMIEEEIVQEESDVENEAAEKEQVKQEPEKPLPPVSTVELFMRRQQKITEVKNKIATVASAIIENPQENVKKLRELRMLFESNDPDVVVTCKKLCIMSMLEIFKDIIPQYTIRLTTEKEKQQSATKDTKSLRDYEETLLQNYRNYLEILEALAKGKKLKTKNKKKCLEDRLNGVEIPRESVGNLKELSVKCMCELLVTHPHFNHRSTLIAVAVPFIGDKNDNVSSMVCSYVKRMFKDDLTGEVTLEVVRTIAKVIKSRQFSIHPKVLNSFLSLKIKEVDRGGPSEKENQKEVKKDRNQMSRRERKRKKQMKELEKELEDAAATQNKKHKLKLHTEVINIVFLTYFRILKQARQSVLLSAVLEGIAKFAHLINVEFFDDLFSVLNELVDSGELSYRECLHCVKTAFIILSGQGTALNIDPLHFYQHLYRTLYKLTAGVTSEDVGTALECLDIMITKRRKQISRHRLIGFIKRLSTLSLQLSADGALGVLASTRNFVLSDSKSDILYDTEHEGTGMYHPELDDPEHCNAHNTALYEFHLTRRHYHPVVRKLSDHLLTGCKTNISTVLPSDHVRKSAADIYDTYNLENLQFLPPMQEKPTAVKKLYLPGEYLQKEMTKDIEKAVGVYTGINTAKLLIHKGFKNNTLDRRTSLSKNKKMKKK